MKPHQKEPNHADRLARQRPYPQNPSHCQAPPQKIQLPPQQAPHHLGKELQRSSEKKGTTPLTDQRISDVNACHRCRVAGLGLLFQDSEAMKALCFRLHQNHTRKNQDA